MPTARTVAQVIAAEAVSGTPEERYADMKAIASVIANRAAMLGVTPEDVVSVTSQFNAYNRQMPPGTAGLVDMAEQAMNDVAVNGPSINSTYYATPAASDNLPNGLVEDAATSGHIYYSDPAARAIITAQGAIRPDPNALPSIASMDPLQKAINAPYENNGLLNGVTSLTNAPATAVTSTSVPAGALDPAFSPSGLLSGNFPASSFQAPSAAPMGALATGDAKLPNLTPSLNSFAPMANAGVPGGEFADVNERMGLAQEGFDPSRFAGPVAPSFDAARYGTPDAVSQAMQTPAAYLDAPEPHPNVNNFADLAAAPPVQAPVDVQGILGQMQQPNLAASASVPMSAGLFSPAAQTPAVDVAASGVLGVNPALAASTTANPLASVPATADLGTTPALAAQAAAVPTANSPALNNFADLAAAGPVQAAQPSQFGDVNSPEMQAMKANVAAQLEGGKYITATPTNNNFSDLAAAGPTASPVSVTPTGILGTTPALAANATATPIDTASVADRMGVLSSLQPTQTPTAAETAINGVLGQSPSLLSSTTIGSQTPNLSVISPSPAMLANSVTPNYQQYQSFVPDDVQPTVSAPAASEDLGISSPDYKSIVAQSFPSTVNVASDPAVSMPSLPALDTVTVADQPTVATPSDTNVTVQGPAATTDTTAAANQTPSLSGSFPAAPAKNTGILGGVLNKGTLTGGLLGTAVAGPVGGILGGLLGNQVNKNGGLTGLLSGQAPNINQINGGMQNLAGIWGGSFPAGTQALANNGTTVTSMGNGWTAVTSANGVTTTFGPNNLHAHYVGPSLTGDNGSPGISGEPGGGGGFGSGLF